MNDEQQNHKLESSPKQPASPRSHSRMVPLAIVAAGALIAGAVYLALGKNTSAPTAADNNTAANQGLSRGDSVSLDQMTAVSASDHIRGNPDAPVKIVEYSDMECPFCKRFHPTMQQAIDEYGKSGKVAWIYRHFPLDAIHSKARPEATAAECAGELGGNAAFWSYIDRFFEVTPSNNQTDINAVLPQIARELGLDATQFASCRASGKYDTHIQDEFDNAVATGGEGTPWSIVVTRSGKKYPLSGAQPYAVVKQLIELALQDT